MPFQLKRVVGTVAFGVVVTAIMVAAIVVMGLNLRAQATAKRLEKAISRLDCLDSCRQYCSPRTTHCTVCVDFCNNEFKP